MEWKQPGFAIISDVNSSGLPFVHGFHTAQWEADRAIKASGALPPDLARNIRVVPAVLSFDPAN